MACAAVSSVAEVGSILALTRLVWQAEHSALNLRVEKFSRERHCARSSTLRTIRGSHGLYCSRGLLAVTEQMRV